MESYFEDDLFKEEILEALKLSSGNRAGDQNGNVLSLVLDLGKGRK